MGHARTAATQLEVLNALANRPGHQATLQSLVAEILGCFEGSIVLEALSDLLAASLVTAARAPGARAPGADLVWRLTDAGKGYMDAWDNQ